MMRVTAVSQMLMWATLGSILCSGVALSEQILYVDMQAIGSNDGSSWANAYVHLQDALHEIGESNEHVEIRVATGTYKPDQGKMMVVGIHVSFRLSHNASLKGGYAGNGALDPNVRDINQYPTILSGDLEGNDSQDEVEEPWHEWDNLSDNVSTVVMVSDANATIDGFSIVGGRYRIVGRGGGDVWGGSGMSISTASVKIMNCTFRSNGTATTSGGAVFIAPECQVSIQNSIFGNNYARGQGGALYSSGAYVNLDRCAFLENRSLSSGGAIASVGGRITSVSCEFVRNSSASRYPGINGFGGAVTGDRDSVLVFWNTQFIANTAAIGGGAVRGSNMELTNCTIAGNRASSFAAILVDRSPAELLCCIIWDNKTSDQSDPGTPNWIGTCSYCCLDPQQEASLAVGNIHTNPAFALPGHWDSNGTANDPNDDFWIDGDYHLKSQAGRWDRSSQTWVQDDVTSPCIDAGDPDSPIGLEPFPNGSIVNMGAYGGTAEASKSYFGKPVCETIIAGDINGDCQVDYQDLAILSRQWLRDCSD